MIEKRKAGLQVTASHMIAVALGVALFAGEHQALADSATDQRCAKGDDIRRIEIRFADDNGGLPCRVIYRPDSESDRLGTVSWRNISDLAACQAQANEVIERLTVEGWTCAEDATASDDAGQTVARLPIEDAVESPSRDDPPPAAESAPDVDAADDRVNQDEDIDQPARLVENPDLPPPSDDLASMIEDDLGRLDTT
ncbi:MAG: hypothetical protein OEU92_03025, partial [Alphaproteobacteria bacterium]|nr:hypothetical protein [Alphaproteobacteria bacterium]